MTNQVAAINQSSSSESILDLAKVRDWESVILRCRTNPMEAATIRGKLNESVLHWICFHDCPLPAVQALIQVDPESLVSVDRFGQTPLHVLCSRQWKYDIERQSSEKTSIIKYMISENKSIVNIRDKQGLTPLQVLWMEFQKNMSLYRSVHSREQDFLLFVKKAEVVIESVNHIVHAMISNENFYSSRPWSLLYEVICSKSIPKKMRRSLVNLSAIVRPTLASQHTKSQEGYIVFPLHAALHDDSCPLHTAGYRTSRRILRNITDQYFDLSSLVRAYPEAAGMKDERCKRFPLFIALENRYTWTNGIFYLVQAAPFVLLERDRKHNLYAFQVAAIEGKTDISTVYNLLRYSPSIIKVEHET